MRRAQERQCGGSTGRECYCCQAANSAAVGSRILLTHKPTTRSKGPALNMGPFSAPHTRTQEQGTLSTPPPPTPHPPSGHTKQHLQAPFPSQQTLRRAAVSL